MTNDFAPDLEDLQSGLMLDVWMGELADRSSSTRECYLRDIRQIAHVVAKRIGRSASAADIMSLDTEAIQRMAHGWSTAGDAATTIERRLVSLRRYCRSLAQRTGLSGPVLLARFPPAPRSERQPLPEFEVGDLLVEATRSPDWSYVRNLALSVMIATMGIGTGEMARLDQGSLVRGLLIVDRSPVGPRFLAIPEQLQTLLDRYLTLLPWLRSSLSPLWLHARGGRIEPRSIQIAFRTVRQEFGWTAYAGARAFRRRRVHDLVAEGRTPEEVAELMGIGVATVLHHLRR